MIISGDMFAKSISENVSKDVVSKIDELNIEVEVIDHSELQHVFEILEKENKRDLKISGKSRINDWNNGWQENYNELVETGDYKAILPKYFNKYKYIRFNKNFYKAKEDSEYKMLCALQYHYFEKYFSKTDKIVEFGCGTGHNLLRAREINKTADLYGCDWALSSQKILKTLNDKNILKCVGKNFDFFTPDYDFKIENHGVYTVAALEQIGVNFDNFLTYLITAKPKLCVHIEPLMELFDENNNIDAFCKNYCKKRNYLHGFATKLKELESKNIVEIIELKRNYIGSMFLEGYSVIAWRVL